MRFSAFIRILSVYCLLCTSAFSAGFGGVDFEGAGHSVLRAVAQRNSADPNFIAVGRVWTGSQYRAVLASYGLAGGQQDISFADGNGLLGKRLLDFSGAGFDNMCAAIVYAADGYISACRSMLANGYYDIYLVKFDAKGKLDQGFGTNGIQRTSLGGDSTNGHALVRGIAYNPNTNGVNGGVVAITGAIGSYAPGAFNPFIASFDQKTGAQIASTVKLTGISGTGVGIVYDGASSSYYTVSTDTSGDRHFYFHKFNHSLVPAGAPWGNAVDFLSAGGGADSVPAGLAIMGSDLIAVGGNRVSSTPPWRCALAAVSTATGNLATGFGSVTINGGTSGNGITIFSHDGVSPTRDCILNSVAVAPVGGEIIAAGAAYTGSNYDYLIAKLGETGALESAFGTNGIKSQSVGPGDDILNTMLFMGGSEDVLYAFGRSHNPSLRMGLALSKVTTDDGDFESISTDTWSGISSAGAPESRTGHVAVWTGAKMIVWGGYNGNGLLSGYLRTGGRYDPFTNSWSATNTNGAPSGRLYAKALWTGSKMIVWGGWFGGNYLNDGAAYDPMNDSWTALSSLEAPSGRTDFSVVWTGSRMIVFGGYNDSSGQLNDGKIYNPDTNSWQPMSSVNSPSIRQLHSAVWTGSKMIVWGGYGASDAGGTGAAYDPSGDTWTSISSTGAPSARDAHVAVWTGSKMIVWGGEDAESNLLSTGGIYDPSADSWTPVTNTGAPSARGHYMWGFTGIWTGSKLIVWGGFDSDYIDTGGQYNPVTNVWLATPTSALAKGCTQHTAVWTGHKMISWGGYGAGPDGFGAGVSFTPSTAF